MAPFLSSLLQQNHFSVVHSAPQFIKDLGVMNAMANSEVFTYQDHLKQPITLLHTVFSSLAPGTQTPTQRLLLLTLLCWSKLLWILNAVGSAFPVPSILTFWVSSSSS